MSETKGIPFRLPFFYGWVVVAIAFVTMGIGVKTRTAFSLLFPPSHAENGGSTPPGDTKEFNELGLNQLPKLMFSLLYLY